MKKKRADKLHRLLEFIQQDFDQIEGETERTKSLLEGGDLFQNKIFLFADDTSNEGYPWRRLKDLCENTRQLSTEVIRLTKIGGSIYRSIPTLFRCVNSANQSAYSQERVLEPGDSVDKIVLQAFPRSDKPLEIYRASEVIFDLLVGLPFDRLKSCLYCEKMFIQKTAREKKYCCDLCKNRQNLKLKGISK